MLKKRLIILGVVGLVASLTSGACGWQTPKAERPITVLEATTRVNAVQNGKVVTFTFESRAPREQAWTRTRVGILTVSRVDDRGHRIFLWSVAAPRGSRVAVEEITSKHLFDPLGPATIGFRLEEAAVVVGSKCCHPNHGSF